MSDFRQNLLRQLRHGTIFDVAADAGIELRASAGKVPIRCPFHDDRHASAFVSESNTIYCSACTPEGGMGAKRFAEALGLAWEHYVERELTPGASRPKAAKGALEFGPADAVRAWEAARARARDDDAVDADREVYEYLALRKLLPSWESCAFGILADRPDLHEAIGNWPRRGYRVIAPLFNLAGAIVGIQARGLERCDPKTLVPRGCRISGSVFADARGRRVLLGDAPEAETVVLGEGLTDYLALTIASPFAVMTSPGTSNALAAVGAWARDRRVLLALDNDPAGHAATPAVAAALHQRGAAGVFRVNWPDRAKDAADVLSRRGASGLEEFLRRASIWRAA
jgi:hypothetical protein